MLFFHKKRKNLLILWVFLTVLTYFGAKLVKNFGLCKRKRRFLVIFGKKVWWFEKNVVILQANEGDGGVFAEDEARINAGAKDKVKRGLLTCEQN